jgi:hypothetical protein
MKMRYPERVGDEQPSGFFGTSRLRVTRNTVFRSVVFVA